MISYDIITFEVIRRYNNMQRPDGRGEPARTRRQSLEGRGGRKRGEDAERRGGQARSSEAIRGDLRTRSHDEREATRLGGARGWVKESRPSQVYACSLFDRTDSYANTKVD